MTDKKQKGHDYSTIIIWASVIIGAVRYAVAFLAADLGKIEGMLSLFVTYMLGISGLAMGILGSLGTAYIFDGWRKKIPATGVAWNNKFKALTVFVVMSFVTELLILVPFTESRVRHVSIEDVLDGGVWWWSMAVVAMPIILIGGVSLGNQVVTVTAESGGNFPETFRNPSAQAEKDGGNFPKDWRKVRKLLNEQQVSGIADSATKIICDLYGVDERTARNWRDYARKERLSATTTSVEVAK